MNMGWGAIQVLRNAFFWELDPHPPPHNANNIEPYTFVTFFSRKIWHPPPPSVLHNTWMAPEHVTELYRDERGDPPHVSNQNDCSILLGSKKFKM